MKSELYWFVVGIEPMPPKSADPFVTVMPFVRTSIGWSSAELTRLHVDAAS